MAHIAKKFDWLLQEILNNIKSLVLDAMLEKDVGTLLIKQNRVDQVTSDWCDLLSSVIEDFADSDRTSDPSNDEDYRISVNLQELSLKDIKQIFIDYFSNVRYYANLLRKYVKRLREKCEGGVCSILSTSTREDSVSYSNMVYEVESLCKSCQRKLTESYNLICKSDLFQFLQQSAAVPITPLENCSIKRYEQVEVSTNRKMDLRSSLSISSPSKLELQSSSVSLNQSLHSAKQDLHESTQIDETILRARRHLPSVKETQQKAALFSNIDNGSDLKIQTSDKFFSASTKGLNLTASDPYVGKTFRVVVKEVLTPDKFYLSFASVEQKPILKRRSMGASCLQTSNQMTNFSQGTFSKIEVVCCKLYKIKPIDEEWSKHACLYFQCAVKTPCLLEAAFKGIELDNNELIYSVKLTRFDIEPRKRFYDVAQYLVETRFAIDTETEEASQPNKENVNLLVGNQSTFNGQRTNLTGDIPSCSKMPPGFGNVDSLSLNKRLIVKGGQNAVEVLEHDINGLQIKPVAKLGINCSREKVQLVKNLSDAMPSFNERPDNISQLLPKKEGIIAKSSQSPDVHNEDLLLKKVPLLKQRKNVTEQPNSPAACSKKSDNAIKDGTVNVPCIKSDSYENIRFSGDSWSNKDLALVIPEIVQEVNLPLVPTPESVAIEAPVLDYLSKEGLLQRHNEHTPCFPNMSETPTPLFSVPPNFTESFSLRNSVPISTPPPSYFVRPDVANLPANPKRQVSAPAVSIFSQSQIPIPPPLLFPGMPHPMLLRFHHTNYYPPSMFYLPPLPQNSYGFYPPPPSQLSSMPLRYYHNLNSNPQQVKGMDSVQSDNLKIECKKPRNNAFETGKNLKARTNLNSFSVSSQNQDALHKIAGNIVANPSQRKKNISLSNSNQRSNFGAEEQVGKEDATICIMKDKDAKNEGDAKSKCVHFEEMQDFYYTKASSLKKLPEVGELVACQEEKDGNWYRGEVLDVDKDFAQVYLVDIGYETTSNITRLKPLESQFLDLPDKERKGGFTVKNDMIR